VGHTRSEERLGHRWGRTQGKLGFHAGKVTVERPARARSRGPGTCAAELGSCGRHALRQPLRNAPAMQRQIGASGPSRHPGSKEFQRFARKTSRDGDAARRSQFRSSIAIPGNDSVIGFMRNVRGASVVSGRAAGWAAAAGPANYTGRNCSLKPH
jgi:hypothetical protein